MRKSYEGGKSCKTKSGGFTVNERPLAVYPWDFCPPRSLGFQPQNLDFWGGQKFFFCFPQKFFFPKINEIQYITQKPFWLCQVQFWNMKNFITVVICHSTDENHYFSFSNRIFKKIVLPPPELLVQSPPPELCHFEFCTAFLWIVIHGF